MHNFNMEMGTVPSIWGWLHLKDKILENTKDNFENCYKNFRSQVLTKTKQEISGSRN